MPIKIRQGKNKAKDTSKCISKEYRKGKPQAQAIAICLSYANPKKKKK